MRNIRALVITLSLAMALSVPLVVQTQASGGTPPGQPFQDLQAQINALQAQMAAIAGGCGSIMVHGGGISAAGPATFSIPFGGAVSEYRLPRNGTIKNMRILIFENSTNGPVLLTLFVNGTPSSLSATIPAGSTADIDIPGTVSVLAGSTADIDIPGTVSVLDGDTVSVIGDRSGVTSGVIRLSLSYEILEASSTPRVPCEGTVTGVGSRTVTQRGTCVSPTDCPADISLACIGVRLDADTDAKQQCSTRTGKEKCVAVSPVARAACTESCLQLAAGIVDCTIRYSDTYTCDP